MKLADLTPAEREVWERIVRDGWSQMKLLFPRLEQFKAPELKSKLRKRAS